MKNSINSKIAALLLASAVLGGASASMAADNGDYYRGVSKAPIIQGTGVATSGAAAQVNNGGDGTYYTGVSRDPVDTMSTGSIVRDGGATVKVPSGGDGTYYRGISRN